MLKVALCQSVTQGRGVDSHPVTVLLKLALCCCHPCSIMLKVRYYEKLTFSGIWGVIVGLWCCHTPRNFEKRLSLLFWVRYRFLKGSCLQFPDTQVKFAAAVDVADLHMAPPLRVLHRTVSPPTRYSCPGDSPLCY